MSFFLFLLNRAILQHENSSRSAAVAADNDASKFARERFRHDPARPVIARRGRDSRATCIESRSIVRARFCQVYGESVALFLYFPFYLLELIVSRDNIVAKFSDLTVELRPSDRARFRENADAVGVTANPEEIHFTRQNYLATIPLRKPHALSIVRVGRLRCKMSRVDTGRRTVSTVEKRSRSQPCPATIASRGTFISNVVSRLLGNRSKVALLGPVLWRMPFTSHRKSSTSPRREPHRVRLVENKRSIAKYTNYC